MSDARRRLTLEDVLDAAEVLANRPGGQRLALTDLAQALRIRPPSLYTHIASLDGLYRLLSLRAFTRLSQVIETAGLGKSQDVAVLAVARAVRDFARRNPGLYACVIATPPPDDAQWSQAAHRIGTSFSQLLQGYDLDDCETIHAMRGLRSIVHGFVMLESSGAFKQRVNRDQSFEQLLGYFISGIHASARRS